MGFPYFDFPEPGVSSPSSGGAASIITQGYGDGGLVILQGYGGTAPPSRVLPSLVAPSVKVKSGMVDPSRVAATPKKVIG